MKTETVDNVLRTLDAGSQNADDIHNALVGLLRESADLSKKDILADTGLARVFSHNFKGTNRAQIVSWIHEYTPIRVKFRDNGQFDKIAWSDAHVKARKEEGFRAFNIGAADANPWFYFEKARTKSVAKGDIDKAMAAFVKGVARAAYESGSLDGVMHLVQGRVANELPMLLMQHMQSEKYLEWTIERDAAKAKAKQQLANK